MNKVLEIKNLHAGIENKQILKGVNLTIKTGEVHAIMGPNGTGKSTLSSIVSSLFLTTSMVLSLYMLKIFIAMFVVI